MILCWKLEAGSGKHDETMGNEVEKTASSAILGSDDVMAAETASPTFLVQVM